jgi:beta-lactamase regulating signal transducer with metallopeptidase domain
MIKAMMPFSVSLPGTVGNLSLSQFLETTVEKPADELPIAAPVIEMADRGRQTAAEREPATVSPDDFARSNDAPLVAQRLLNNGPLYPYTTPLNEDIRAQQIGQIGATKGALPLQNDSHANTVTAGENKQPQQQITDKISVDARQLPSVPSVAVRRLPSAVSMTIAIWFTVVALLTAIGITRQLRFHRSLRKARCVPVELLPLDFNGICRSLGMKPMPMYELTGLVSPAVYGLFRPIILLPKHLLATANDEEIRWILLHELAHIRRFDVWCALFTRIVSVLFFFNPAVWISKRMIHRLREYACDDFATYYSNVSPIQASEAFMKILRYHSRCQAGHVPALAVLDDSRNSTYTRMRRILDTDQPFYARFGFRSLCLWLFLAALVLPRFVASEKAVGEDVQQPAVADVFGTITGTVTDQQGKPVAGAEVELLFEDTVLKTT